MSRSSARFRGPSGGLLAGALGAVRRAPRTLDSSSRPCSPRDGKGVVPERPVWKIAYVVFMAGLLLLGVALVVVFTVWFITDPNAPVF